jgi:hypothetical protein
LKVSAPKLHGLTKDITGQRFGRLVAIGLHSHGKNNRWKFRCDCGAETVAIISDVRSGNTQSCGCLGIASRIRHGDARQSRRSPEYSSWYAMIGRCENPKNISFKNYGGRGIKVCAAWRGDFTAFLNDLGRKPSPEMSLDRYPNPDGDYEPGNVRWATRSQQRATQRYLGRKKL